MPRSQKRFQPLEPLRPMSWWVVIIALLALGAITIGVYQWLSDVATGVTDTAARAKLRVEIIRNTLTVSAGLGGLGALLLAFRRQRAIEHDAAMIAHDATERRITELRIQAVEQLGSEHSPVRIGGLHNLERLANQYPELRQVVLDEICAYLRRPAPSGEAARSRARPSTDDVPTTVNPPDATDIAARLERDVRRTAQLILQSHLVASSESFWDHDHIDLAGAQLEAANFTECELHHADFIGAELHGETFFGKCSFYGATGFEYVTFHGYVSFANATFRANADFDDAAFQQDADFGYATFLGHADFDNASFRGYPSFAKATFHDSARFDAVVFDHRRVFENAQATLEPTLEHCLPAGWGLVPSADDPSMGVIRPDAT